MKITPEHYEKLESEIKVILDNNPQFIVHYRENYQENNTIIRWRLFYVVCDKDNSTLARELWKYLNDDHIDTALRKITGLK